MGVVFLFLGSPFQILITLGKTTTNAKVHISLHLKSQPTMNPLFKDRIYLILFSLVAFLLCCVFFRLAGKHTFAILLSGSNLALWLENRRLRKALQPA
ncbi:MAG TPA: hypothetical protein VGH19_15055 [Verrucomicrobiae bacterium]